MVFLSEVGAATGTFFVFFFFSLFLPPPKVVGPRGPHNVIKMMIRSHGWVDIQIPLPLEQVWSQKTLNPWIFKVLMKNSPPKWIIKEWIRRVTLLDKKISKNSPKFSAKSDDHRGIQICICGYVELITGVPCWSHRSTPSFPCKSGFLIVDLPESAFLEREIPQEIQVCIFPNKDYSVSRFFQTRTRTLGSPRRVVRALIPWQSYKT